VGLLLWFARQWIAGEGLEDAIARAKVANSLGMGAILNVLGEHYVDPRDIEASMEEYRSVLGAIGDHRLDATISIKLTQCGLNMGREACRANVLRLLEDVEALGSFLWIDMEASRWTDATLDIYEACLDRWPGTGVALQANLRRSEGDLQRLLRKGGKVRLCKGAYREPLEIAYKRRIEIDANFLRLMRTLFESGEYFAVATHDIRMIQEARALAPGHDGRFEFEMLMGVRDSLKALLAREGYRVVEYVPYGPQWLPYFSRRLRERPSNLLTMVKSMVRG
jgi:proline dehydrogenase